MKHTIEIKCPEGYKPIYDEDSGKVTIVPTNPLKAIETIEDAINILNLCESTVSQEISTLKDISPSLSAKYQCDIINEALHKVCGVSVPDSLVEGVVYNPYIFFYLEGKVPKDRKKDIVGAFSHKGKKYLLVCFSACLGSAAGLGDFDSGHAVGDAAADVGFLPCATREIAEYFSKNFAKLYFNALYGYNVDYYFLLI